jgi:tetratricopeptide (TPR) repeat protein
MELGRPALDQARSHHNFGVVLMRAGKLEEAAREMERAITLAADRSVPIPKKADYLYNLGLVRNRQGDFTGALKNFHQALDLLEPLADSGVQRAEILLDVANALNEHSPDEARRELERGLHLVENDPAGRVIRAKLLFNLAQDTEERLGRPEEAVDVYREVVRLIAAGTDDEAIGAFALHYIGNQLVRTGRTEEAIRTYRDAVTKLEAVEPSAPALATIRRNLGLSLVKVQRSLEALPYFVAGLRGDWSPAVASLPAQTSLQKGQTIGSLASWLQPIYALAFAEPNRSGGIAYEAALLTKALHSEARRLEHVVLGGSASGGAAALQARYLELRRQISTRILQQDTSGTAAEETTRLAKEARRIESELARDPSVSRPEATLTATTVDAVKATLRPGDVLLDYVTYDGRFSDGQWQDTAKRYGVFVVDGFSGRVTAVDLGEQESVDATITAFRERQRAQTDPVSGRLDEVELARAAEAVRRRILDPALKGITSATRVYIAPDGLIGLVPFEVLPANAAATPIRYLVETSEIVYLLTGRNLVRPTSSTANRTKDVWLVGDPTYDAPPEQRLAAVGPVSTVAAALGDMTSQTMQVVANGQLSAASSEVPTNWVRLEGTRTIVAVAATAAQRAGFTPRILVNDAASEENATAIERPRVLMLATHGYFMPNMPPVKFHMSGGANKRATVNEDLFDAGDPLQRSMLVLAGANRRSHTVTRYQV